MQSDRGGLEMPVEMFELYSWWNGEPLTGGT